MRSREIVENCHVLPAVVISEKFHSKIPENVAPILKWNDGFSASLERRNGIILLHYIVNSVQIDLIINTYLTLQPNGGFRYSFRCSKQGCTTKNRKLYLPPGKHFFRCRKCYNLTYRSCNESHKDDALLGLIASNLNMTLSEVRSKVNGLTR